MLFLGFLLLSSCLALPLDVDETESTNAKSGNLKVRHMVDIRDEDNIYHKSKIK